MAENQTQPQVQEEEFYSLSNSPYTSISKQELDSIVQLYKDENLQESFLSDFAKQIAEELAIENPDFSYENLTSGTGPYFDRNIDEDVRSQKPRFRAYSDREIITNFVIDPEGRPLEVPTAGEGFFREIGPQTLGFSGAVSGAKVGARLPLPPQGKLAAATTLSVLGGLGLYEAGKYATDVFIGPERPLLPGEKVTYEQGKTAAGVVPWLLLPWTISKDVSLGTAQYLTNLGKNSRAPGGVRLAEKAENFLRKTAKEGREKPGRSLGVETMIGAGQVYGAGGAERLAEDNGLVRILFETGGGIAASALVNPTAAVLLNLKEVGNVLSGLSKDVQEKGFKGVLAPLRTRRQQNAVNKVISVLEKEALDLAPLPDDLTEEAISKLPVEQQAAKRQERAKFEEKIQAEYIDLIVENLSSDELTKNLIDDGGQPINLTSGQKSGSASLLAMEKALEKLGMGLGQERKVASTKAIKALRNTILALAQTDDKNAVLLAASLSEKAFAASMQNQLEIATKRIVDAAEKVYGKTPESNLVVSERLYDVIDTELGLARRKEKELWRAVPEINITSFEDDVPEFVTAYENIGKTPEVVEELTNSIPAFKKFVERKKTELGIGAKEGAEEGAEEIVEEVVGEAGVTTTELAEMRGLMLDYGRTLSASGQRNKARVAFDMADALLSDLNNAPDVDADWRLAYDMARSYSKALNDTYTRAFGGEVSQTVKTGAEKLHPELLARRLLSGGNDPTYIRVEQINQIGKFGQEYGLEGAEETIGTLSGLTETILRNARRAAFDPETGQINPASLRKWLVQNEDLMNQFPALRRDLERAETANVLLDTTKKAHKKRLAEIKNQISFMNLLPSETDNPTTAVAAVLASKKPIQGLNELDRLVNAKSLPENVRNEARNGLKASVLEWVFTKAGGSHSGTLRPSQIYDSFFRPIKNSINDISLSEWLRSKNLITEGEVVSLKAMLDEMVKYEAAETLGDSAEDIVDAPNQLLDLYLSITGSAFGTRLQRLFGGAGPGSIIAAGKGAKAFREAFLNIPQGLQLDVMKELMQNPEMLARMMKRPRSEREALRLREQIQQGLFNLGLSPAKTTPAPIFRETMEDDVERLYLPGEEPKRDIPGIDSPLVQRERTPALPTRSAAAPEQRPFVVAEAPTSDSSGVASLLPQGKPDPNVRRQYGQLFPYDIVSA